MVQVRFSSESDQEKSRRLNARSIRSLKKAVETAFFAFQADCIDFDFTTNFDFKADL